MKILCVRGCNIASLKDEFEIDFTQKPLISAGIYAITGPTGSGKSTILDTICLPLFNTTPRANNAETEKINDTKEHQISLNDSANILRRGTASGYAEVEFISLSGETYRSRWSISRAHNKVNGKLKQSQINITNLTKNEEVQGTKTELLKKIVELIGLTFDQFTRAVLLAQGDFATFLKAPKKEKADLLEKLTGTDTYTRISKRIFEENRESAAQYEIVKQKIEGIEIIDTEQLLTIQNEKEVCESEISKLLSEEKKLTEHLNWIEQDKKITNSIEEATIQQQKYIDANKIANKRFELLSKIDSIQEIRDEYRELETQNKELITNQSLISSEYSKRENCQKNVDKININVEQFRNEYNNVIKKWDELQPSIIKAREFDLLIDEKQKTIISEENKLKTTIKEYNSEDELSKKLSKNISDNEIRLTKANTWFEKNSYYAEISPRFELLINHINSCINCKTHIEENNKLISSYNSILEQEKNNLATARKEEEHLNSILPSEVANLRARLVEGEPCAVCGSTHHPIIYQVAETLAEDLLVQKRKVCTANIERIEKNISDKQQHISSLATLTDSYNNQLNNIKSDIASILINYPNWLELFENNILHKELTTLENQWQKSLIARIQLEEEIKENRQIYLSDSKNLYKKQLLINEEKQLLEQSNKELLKLQENRKLLINGNSIKDIEQSRQKEINSRKIELDKVIENSNNLTIQLKEIETTIQLIDKNILNNKQKITALNNSISIWISLHQNANTIEEIKELFIYDTAWIAKEREELDRLKSSLIATTSTLNERIKNSAEHRKSKINSLTHLSENELKTIHQTTTNQIKIKQTRIGEINSIITQYNKNKAQIKEYEKELETKRTTANNWAKLNELLGSADGAKFKTIAQGFTLDVLLTYANIHLRSISERYVLERLSPESLSLQVRDLDMLSEIRSVHSLSGGESFLISLALALGLSSLSSNRMRIESLFIDEGFGSLDADTLRTAMDALERLQMQGRKIGVISHVSEMTERIPVQIKVTKTTNGSSQINIISN